MHGIDGGAYCAKGMLGVWEQTIIFEFLLRRIFKTPEFDYNLLSLSTTTTNRSKNGS